MKNFWLAFFVGCFLCEDAYAYLDPGSASLWIQGILAAVAGAVASARVWWGWLKSKVNRKKP